MNIILSRVIVEEKLQVLYAYLEELDSRQDEDLMKETIVSEAKDLAQRSYGYFFQNVLSYKFRLDSSVKSLPPSPKIEYSPEPRAGRVVSTHV